MGLGIDDCVMNIEFIDARSRSHSPSFLNSPWLEIDHYQNLKMKCTEHVKALPELIDRVNFSFSTRT